MRVIDNGSRPVPASLRRLVASLVRGQAPAVQVSRRQIPYWRERGWTLDGNEYSGSYQTPFGAFQGWIEQERSGHIKFYLHSPSPQIQRHSHWTCFQHSGHDWYLIHMARQPRGRQLRNYDY